MDVDNDSPESSENHCVRPKQVVKPSKLIKIVKSSTATINSDAISFNYRTRTPSNVSIGELVCSFDPKPKQIVRPRVVYIETNRPDLPVQQEELLQSTRSNRVSSKKGYALILNHHRYENEYVTTRHGTFQDVQKLNEVFGDYNIETHAKEDLKLDEIKKEIELLKYKDFSSYECFIIVILTHGNRNEILCSADKPYNFIYEIEDPLLIENKTLLDKPKIFVIQACRGSDEMPVIETDSVPIHRNFTVVKRNIFKCNATYEGYVSFRNTKQGTIFIQTFCNQLQLIGKYTTIYNVMMKVIEEVSKNPEVPQVPTVVSSMTNSFCFGKLLK